MTTIYFIRHAEPARGKTAAISNDMLSCQSENTLHPLTDATYPLTDKGKADCALVTHFLRDKNVDAVLSSPFKRAFDTVAHFATEAGLDIETVEDFRERRITYEHVWVEDFRTYGEAQWADFSYKLEDGESLGEVQARNIAALEDVLRRYKGKTLVVGTHGTALSLIINYLDPTYGAADFWDMASRMPWAVKMVFDNGENADGAARCVDDALQCMEDTPQCLNDSPQYVEDTPQCLDDTPKFANDALRCVQIEKIDLFAHENLVAGCFPLQTFNEYAFTVIFARQVIEGEWRWLYVRHKERTTYECAGGHIEPGETPLEGAKRELQEETGAVKFYIHPAFDYTSHREGVYKTGRVFLADIIEPGNIPAESEIGEVRTFADIPDTMTYPHILPVLFANMQKWLAQNTPDEYWDLLDADRNPLGITHKRGLPKPPGTYSTVVRSWVMNAKGEILSTRRSLSKLGSPGIWEIPCGSVCAGETSLQAAVRELKEEAGIAVPPECGTMFYSKRENGAFWDNWLFRHEFDLADVVLQEGETMDARAVTLNDIAEMVKAGYFVCEELETLRIYFK